MTLLVPHHPHLCRSHHPIPVSAKYLRYHRSHASSRRWLAARTAPRAGSGRNSPPIYGTAPFIHLFIRSFMPSFSTPHGVLSLPVPLLIVVAIDPRPAQIYHLGASLPIFLQARTLLAVIGIRHARPAADNTSPSKRPLVALVADTHKRVLPREAVAATVTACFCFVSCTCNCSCNAFFVSIGGPLGPLALRAAHTDDTRRLGRGPDVFHVVVGHRRHGGTRSCIHAAPLVRS